LGYGHFGAKVTMDDSPLFDHMDLFDQKRIRLVDIDGSGAVDLLYLGAQRIDIYFNQSGNRWSQPQALTTFPRIDTLASVQALDLLGNGTACLVWGTPLPTDAGRAMRYIDLMGSQKPHLLVKVANNLGAQTLIAYAPSTKFYIQDRLAGTPWITKLPFPVHCVETVTVKDQWRRTTFTTTYSYHHGYFDGWEREFRGFGRVEQRDVEDYDTFSKGNIESPYITDEQRLYQPPIKTITWFHTGAALDRQRILTQFEGEYFYNRFPNLPDFAEKPLPDPDFAQQDMSADEWREALRSCKGMMLRQEIYELAVGALAHQQDRPIQIFTASTHNCHIQRLQPRGDNRHAVFLVTESEALTYHYELALSASGPLRPDPRIMHTLTLRQNDYGNPQQAVAVVYPRIRPHEGATPKLDAIHKVQGETHIVYTETRYTADVFRSAPGRPLAHHRLTMPYEVLTYELTQLADPTKHPDPEQRYFTLEQLRAHDLSSRYPMPANERIMMTPLAYHERPQDKTPHQRQVEHVLTLYFDDDDAVVQLQYPLSPGQHGPRGLKYEDYKLALTDALLNAVFITGAENKLALSIEGALTARERLQTKSLSGYLSGEDLSARLFDAAKNDEYWMCSGIAGFEADAPQRFYLPERYTDPFGNETRLRYDARDLYISASTDALHNTTEVVHFDYRVLAPREMKDINDNLIELVFDVRGMVVATAVKGKGAEADDLEAFQDFLVTNPPFSDIETFFNTNTFDRDQAELWLKHATTRFVYHFGDTRALNNDVVWHARPAGACGIQREQHVKFLADGTDLKFQVALECSDGAGSILMKKVQAEPKNIGGPLRWIVTGKTVLNNKGKPVKQYEPYFSDDFGCTEADEAGFPSIMYYDAVDRLVRTEMPDGAFSRVEFSPWHITRFDANDTVLEAGHGWYLRNSAADASEAQVRAAGLAAQHANTPSRAFLDSLGREVMTIAHNRAPNDSGQWIDAYYTTFTKLDAEGKPLWIQDARNNLVMRYTVPIRLTSGDLSIPTVDFCPTYDIAGHLLYQHSMDAGDRWMLMDAADKPMLLWDANEWPSSTGTIIEKRLYLTNYDALHRPTEQWLRVNNQPAAMIERFIYRDNDPAARLLNLNGQLVLHYNPSGRTETIRRDFNGNTQEIRRRLNNSPQEAVIDWKGSTPDAKLESEVFVQRTQYDALNRITRLVNWHRASKGERAIYVPRYSARGLLVGESLTIGGVTTEAIRRIEYDAKGQKQFLELGNNTLTQYDYDPQTYRLRQLRTTRPTDATAFPERHSNLLDNAIIQQLHYTYDPVGNITEIYDEAYEPVFFNKQKVEPRSRYTYDALYRLIEAEGRENITANTAPIPDEPGPIPVNPFPITGQALRVYRQTYHYDEAGNFTQMKHWAGNGNFSERWTRHYKPDLHSNRLLRTWTGSDPNEGISYHYDTHGNTLNLDDVSEDQYMRWDHRDMIRALNMIGGGLAYYQYDADKQRTRKRLEHGAIVEERISLGGYELYRRYSRGTNTAPVEEIESHHLFEGEQRVLLVEDVLIAKSRSNGSPGIVKTFLRYQYSNHLGSACLELDHAAAIISYEEYHPYGTSAYRAVNSGLEAPPKRYRYTGMERDEESGLNYHTARYYAPWLGRWVSCDPSGLVDGLNLYGYARCNPDVRKDITGTVSPSVIDHEIDERNEKKAHELRDNEPPPKHPQEKTKGVHNVTKEHQEKVLFLINWAIASAIKDDISRNGRLANDKYTILTEALRKVASLRESTKVPDAPDNLIYRDADHYFAARVQEYSSKFGSQIADKVRTAGLPEQVADAAKNWWDENIHQRPSIENNRHAYQISSLYETIKIAGFIKEVRTGEKNLVATTNKSPSAAGGIEWALLGMIDYDRYDAGSEHRVELPHIAIDLPGTGKRYATDMELPEYLRDAAERTSSMFKYQKSTK
jgi:RHS repeat-associated protein